MKSKCAKVKNKSAQKKILSERKLAPKNQQKYDKSRKPEISIITISKPPYMIHQVCYLH
jgi:hypothetical protein